MYFAAAFQLQKEAALSCQKVLAMQNWRKQNKAGWTIFVRHRCISREDFDVGAVYNLSYFPNDRTIYQNKVYSFPQSQGRPWEICTTGSCNRSQTWPSDFVVQCYLNAPSQAHLPRTVGDPHELCRNITVWIWISAAGHKHEPQAGQWCLLLLPLNPRSKSYCQSLQTDLSFGGPWIRPLMPSSKSCLQQYQPVQQHFKPKTFVIENGIVKKWAFLSLNTSVVSLEIFQISFDSLLAFISMGCAYGTKYSLLVCIKCFTWPKIISYVCGYFSICQMRRGKSGSSETLSPHAHTQFFTAKWISTYNDHTRLCIWKLKRSSSKLFLKHLIYAWKHEVLV